METDEERTARLEKTVATTQLRRQRKKEEQKKRNGFDLENFQKQKNSRNELARPVIGTIFLVVFLFFL